MPTPKHTWTNIAVCDMLMFVFVERHGHSPPLINYWSKTAQSAYINLLQNALVHFCAENMQFSFNLFKEGYCNYVHKLWPKQGRMSWRTIYWPKENLYTMKKFITAFLMTLLHTRNRHCSILHHHYEDQLLCTVRMIKSFCSACHYRMYVVC